MNLQGFIIVGNKSSKYMRNFRERKVSDTRFKKYSKTRTIFSIFS